MTEFRTKGKGKERKIYPVKKRQAFGVPRNLAYDEVQELRKQGKRARLIKTNQRLDLYAPYEGMLLQESSATAKPARAPEPVSVTTENAAGPSKQRNISYGDKVDVRELIGIDNLRGKLNLNSEDLKMFFSSGNMKITIDNGTLTFISVDPSHVAMIQETMETNLPNGYLDPTSYGKEFSTEWMNNPPKSGTNLRWPSLDYEQDSWDVRLEGDQLRPFLNFLQKTKDDTVRFSLEGDTKKASVGIYRSVDDPDSYKPKRELIETVSAVSSRQPRDVPSGWVTSEKATFATEYLRSTIRTMLGRNEFQNPKEAVLTLRMKRDYPVEFSTRKIGPNGEHIEVKGIIAPRME
ncbi:MAG: hypothetical protein KIS29_10165 [Thermoplasmata archaeon]|nr:hypothetical protein [Candidatus Sysuiplasma jiujiangense]